MKKLANAIGLLPVALLPLLIAQTAQAQPVDGMRF